MATRLTKLVIKEFALVDKGAGKGVPITLTKRREPQEIKKMTVDEILAKLPEADRAVMQAALAAAAKKPEPAPEMKADQPPAGVAPGVAKAWPTLSEEVKKHFVDQAKVAAEAEAKARADEVKKADELRAEVQKLRDAEERREFIAKAEKLKAVPGLSTDELATLLHAVSKGRAVPSEIAKKLEASLASVDEVVRKSKLFSESGSLGRGGEGSARSKIEAIAKSILEKDAKLTIEKARVQAAESNPDLYREAQAEQSKARKAHKRAA